MTSHDVRANEPDHDRFAFGENWANFLRTLDDTKIENAASLS